MKRMCYACLLATLLGLGAVWSVEAQGPFSAQIVRALNAFLLTAHTWTGVQTFSGGTAFLGQSLGPDGTSAAPTFAFTSQTNTGIYHAAANDISFSSNGSRVVAIAGADVYLFGATPTIRMGASSDLILAYDAANILALRNGTNANQLNIYNTYTSSTNNELFAVDWKTTANQARVGTFKGSGGGTVQPWTLIWPGTTPGTLLNGDTWIDTAAGNWTTAATTINLKARNNGVTRTIGSVTF